jgi:capsular polysaccharide biosynthesis protein
MPSGRVHFNIESARLGLPNTSFYHWVSEDLPTFLLNKSGSAALSYEKTIGINTEVINFLNCKTIKVPKWVLLNELEFVTKKPDLGKLHPYYAKTLQDFATKVVGKDISGSNNFYISRKNSRRSLKEEGVFESELSKLNVKIIYAEDYSFLEQIKLFSTAKTIIGVQGAGLVHSIWSKNCNVIEIDNNKELNRCFEWQTYLLGGSFQSIALSQKYNAKEVVDQIYAAIHSV